MATLGEVISSGGGRHEEAVRPAPGSPPGPDGRARERSMSSSRSRRRTSRRRTRGSIRSKWRCDGREQAVAALTASLGEDHPQTAGEVERLRELEERRASPLITSRPFSRVPSRGRSGPGHARGGESCDGWYPKRTIPVTGPVHTAWRSCWFWGVAGRTLRRTPVTTRIRLRRTSRRARRRVSTRPSAPGSA